MFSLVMRGGAKGGGVFCSLNHSSRPDSMKSILSKSLLASLSLLALSALPSQAAVIVTLPTPSTTGSLVITNDISFTLTAALAVGNFFEVVFDEWVTSDGGTNTTSITTPVLLAKNGTAFTTTFNTINDNLATTTGDITPNDGFLDLGTPQAFAIGDILTLKAATYVLATHPGGLNPQANQTFTGNAFLAFDYGISGIRISADTSVGAVPEPSRALLLLGGLAGVALRRRRLS
jgi:hypothetical protein